VYYALGSEEDPYTSVPTVVYKKKIYTCYFAIEQYSDTFLLNTWWAVPPAAASHLRFSGELGIGLRAEDKKVQVQYFFIYINIFYHNN
jgi:hypothetical protein